jgi:hypothetical protein
MFPNYQERVQRRAILTALANRSDETEAQTLARVLPIWNALPTFQQGWFPDFGAGLQQRLKAQHERESD